MLSNLDPIIEYSETESKKRKYYLQLQLRRQDIALFSYDETSLQGLYQIYLMLHKKYIGQ